MLGTGGAFNVQLTPTELAQQAAAQTTTQATGQPAPADTDLIQPTSGLLQTGVDGFEAYYDSYNTLRDFADTAFIKYGIDVTRPDPRIPGSAAMVRAYNRMFSDTQRLGMQLRSGYEYSKSLQDAALRGDIFLPAQFATGQISTSQTNLFPLQSKTLDFITEYNKQLDNTKIVSQSQLQTEANRRQGLIDWLDTDYLQQLQNQGYDPEYARQFVEDQKKRLRQPTMDEYARQSLSQEWQGLSMRERELRAKEAGEPTQQVAAIRAQIINDLITNPDSQYLGSFAGGQVGGSFMESGKRAANVPAGINLATGGRMGNTLVIPTYSVSSGIRIPNTEEEWLYIDLTSEDAATQLNNYLNTTVPSKDRVTAEQISPYFSGGKYIGFRDVQLTPTQAGQGQNPNDPLNLGI